MKELFDKRFWRGVVKTFVEAREGIDRDNLRPRPTPAIDASKASPADPPKAPGPDQPTED